MTQSLSIAGQPTRAELGMVSYQTNILGTRGPRKMSALIPALRDEQEQCLLQPRDPADSLLERYASQSEPIIIKHTSSQRLSVCTTITMKVCDIPSDTMAAQTSPFACQQESTRNLNVNILSIATGVMGCQE